MTTNASLIDLEELYQLENLDFIARQVVEGFIIGLHKSPYHGFSVEFAEHRLYNSGESTKHIDWKVFARTDRLFVKRFEEETNLRCQIVIDASSSMYYPDLKGKKLPVNKMRFAVTAAASLIHLLKKQRDAVGLTIFSDQVEEHSRARSTHVHHKLLFRNLEKLLEQSPRDKKTDASTSLHRIAEQLHKRSLVIIFSDMMDNVADEGTDGNGLNEIFSALQHLRYNKHEVILFHVVDKQKELDFEFENRPYLFVDVETGEKVKLHPNEVKDFYIEQMEQFKKSLKLRCAQYRIDFIEADINQDYRQILLPYLLKRSKMQ